MSTSELAKRCFVDTNIWLYALVESDGTSKRATAKDIVSQGGAVVSTQVINETCVNLLKKANLTEAQIRHLVVAFYAKYEVVETNEAVLLRASDIREQYSLSFWDSLVIANALEADCTILYTEDMQNGLQIAGQLTIINPFVKTSYKD